MILSPKDQIHKIKDPHAKIHMREFHPIKNLNNSWKLLAANFLLLVGLLTLEGKQPKRNFHPMMKELINKKKDLIKSSWNRMRS